MIRWVLFLALAAAAVGYAFWVYLRVELGVSWAWRLAAARALALVLILALLFDFRLPGSGAGAATDRWVLLDASLSMGAISPGGASAWEAASLRAAELEDDGWRVVTFGAATDEATLEQEAPGPSDAKTLLAPALRRAAESGAQQVTVLSDLRLEDRVEVRAALGALPLDVAFERFGGEVVNAGVSMLEVPDQARAGGTMTAEVELHTTGGDSLTVTIFEEGTEVAATTVGAPLPGLRSRVTVELPPPTSEGRVRYTASVSVGGDGFPSDDAAVAFASVGYDEGAVVLVSLRPDWEPRYLLPVLEEVTGLPGAGYLRVGSDAFVPMGRAVDRGAAVDTMTVGRAAAEAAVLVLLGLDRDADAWARGLVALPAPKIVLPGDATGSELAGVSTGDPQSGEWYASADVPTSPIAGALSGLTLQGLPPLGGALLPSDPTRVRGALLVQLRGAGSPEAAIHLEDLDEGRQAVVLVSGLWRWAARPDGREAYRRVWSGVAGWLLADRSSQTAEVRPQRWVVERDQAVVWGVPGDTVGRRLVVASVDAVERGAADSIVVDTLLAGGGAASTGVLPPGPYRYRVASVDGETVAEGRFDVSSATAEMLPAPAEPAEAAGAEGPLARLEPAGSPLRTRPWPYLLVIGLLCGEWIGRRRSGLR